MSKVRDLTGQRFGRLTANRISGQHKGRGMVWECLCDCGATTHVRSGKLCSGHTRSCGCLVRETTSERSKKHGRSRDAIWWIWQGMKQRCQNPSNRSYDRYGGRGIQVCDRWLESFEAFLEDMGERPSPAHQVDRIDNEGDYCKSNCRWSTAREQSENRRNTRLFEYNGEKMTLTRWAEKTDIKLSTISMRIYKLGWTIEEALTRHP